MLTKRLFDIAVIVLALPIWLPALVFGCLLLKVGQRGAVFFVQERPGQNAKPFKLLKLRTMSDERDADGNLLGDGERLTRIGKLIRNTSIDEIPQLLNVLKGDMSLVGPRPLLMEYLPLFSDFHRRRMEVLPGITGLAQIRGRNLLPWDERLAADIEYVDTRSLWLDVRILAATVVSLLSRRGISSGTAATMEPYKGPDQQS